MPPKKKAKEPEIVDISGSFLNHIDLHKYCPRKIFDILFVNEADAYSNEVSKKIVELSRNYEDMSCLTFITYDEVMDLIPNHQNSNLPTALKMKLVDTCENLKEIVRNGLEIPSDLFAQLMKLKLIEVMYTHYTKEVIKMQKRTKLQDDLNILTKECVNAAGGKGKGKGKGKDDSKKGGAKTAKSSGTSGDKKNKKKENVVEEVKIIEDYTTIPIVGENEIVFDDDIYEQVVFYAFQGFYDSRLLLELIYNNNVPITSVIKITADSWDGNIDMSTKSVNEKYTLFWNKIYKYFDGPDRATCLEDTNLMSFNPSNTDYLEVFEELLYTVKSISDIKLQHLNYVRHIQIYEIEKSYNYFPLECLNVYSKILEKLPIELTNEPIVLNSLLNEVCARVGNIKYNTSVSESSSSQSMMSARKYSRDYCVSPCSIGVFFKNELKTDLKRIVLRKPKKSFLTYENDELTILLNSYKKIGPFVHDLTLTMLKNTIPLINLNNYIRDNKEIIHKHDIDPSIKTVKGDEEVLWHIMYLLMFCGFEHREILNEFEETDLTKFLQIYDQLQYVESLQTKILDENIEETELIESTNLEEEEEQQIQNLYNVPAIKYFWKETLSSVVLPQEISNMAHEYLYVEYKYSPETDNLLLQFSDCLDEFGIKTKVYEQSLITPVCFRDFCKYVSIDATEWLEANEPPKYVRKRESLEECKGVNKIDQLQIFQEYRYLLDSNVKSEMEEEVKEKSVVAKEKVTFEYLVEELTNYPPSSRIIEECRRSQKEKKFLAYDFGTKYFKINGAKTIFHSHDNVKLSVDNTRFLDEDPKCTVNLSCKNNSLVLHSNKFYLKKDYTFHMNLSDGTIVLFIVTNPKTAKGKERVEASDDNSESENSEGVVETETEVQQEPVVDFGGQANVLSVDSKYFKSKIENNLEEDNFDFFQQPDNIFGSLKQATLSKAPIYKVTNKVTTNQPLLEKLKPVVKIPLTNIIKRVLHKTIRKDNADSFIKRNIPKNKYGSTVNHTVNARITLPNGLYITFYPSEVKKAYVEVKQEFLKKSLKHNCIAEEEFRLFTREGYILIKKINGTITILKSNGDTINFENIDTDSENVNIWNLRPCHCKNIDDYRKKLNKILKKESKGITTTAISRRALFQTKKGYPVNEEIVDMLERSTVPYLKNTLIKFDGTRICLQSGKITQKKIYYITQEQDFFAQEIFFERSDGFTSCFDINGKQQVKFADGTKISSTIHIARELVDGYVYISLNFQYDHPSYRTVFYRFDNSLEILLNNGVYKREVNDTMFLKIDDDIMTTVNKHNITFEKTCPTCNSNYNCDFNIKPFYTHTMELSKQFVHVQDSYNKHFYVDYAGNCTRNSNYIKGPFNVNNCNHWKRMVYKKLFVVNRDFSGEMFLTDNLVTARRRRFENEDNCSVSDYQKNNVNVLKFRRKVFTHYSNRFLNINLMKEQLCLSKYKQPEVNDLFYTIFSIINKMTDIEGIRTFISNLLAYFSSTNMNSELLYILKKMLDEYEICMQEDNSSMKSEHIEVPDISCKCIKVRVGILDKLKKWKELCGKYRTLIHNNDIPFYFASPFCQLIEQ